MKRFLLLTLIAGLSRTASAGLITHTDYTAGSAVSAAGQNANENTIVNEMNGNLSAANLAANAVTTPKIADANVTAAKLESPITLSSGTITNFTASTVTATALNVRGTIRQFAYTRNATASATTSSTFQGTNLAVTFTTLNAGSTVYVLITGDMSIATVSNVNAFLTLKRDTTDLASGSVGFASLLSSASQTLRVPVSIIAKDVPGAVGSYVYKVFIRNGDNTTSVSFPTANNVDCSIFIIEVY